MKRRSFLGGTAAVFALACLARPASASAATDAPDVPQVLTTVQSRAFRAWMVRIVSAKLNAGPTPRWTQRDCAGLVRFATAEALRDHDEKWKHANGLAGQAVPPEVQLTRAQQALRNAWRLADGSVSAFADELELVQGNCRFRGKDCNLAQPGDLLFFISGRRGNVSHVGMYIGDGHFIEAAGPGVHISSMRPGDANYDARHMENFAWARRVVP